MRRKAQESYDFKGFVAYFYSLWAIYLSLIEAKFNRVFRNIKEKLQRKIIIIKINKLQKIYRIFWKADQKFRSLSRSTLEF